MTAFRDRKIDEVVNMQKKSSEIGIPFWNEKFAVSVRQLVFASSQNRFYRSPVEPNPYERALYLKAVMVLVSKLVKSKSTVQ